MIVYAPSYAGLVQALKIVSWDELIVFSNNEAIIEFCEMSKIKYSLIRTKKPTSWAEIKKYRDYLSEFAKTIYRKDILFCFYGFDILGLYLMYQLKNNNNNVFFYNKDHHFSGISIYKLFQRKKDFKDFLIYFLLLKIPFSFFVINPNRVFFGIQPIKLSKDFKCLDYFIDEKTFEKNKFHISSILNIPNKSIVFVDQGNTSFEVSIDVINWLENKYENREIYVKAHPNFPLSNISLSRFNLLPSYVPLDLLINKNIELVGVYSTVLLDSVNICKVTSILELVDWKNKEEYEKYKSIISQCEKIKIVEQTKN